MEIEERVQPTILTAVVAWASGALLVLVVAAYPEFEFSEGAMLGAVLAMLLAQISPWQPSVKSGPARFVLAGLSLGVTLVVFAKYFSAIVKELPSGYVADNALVASVGLGLSIVGPLFLLASEREFASRSHGSLWLVLAAFPGLLLVLASGVLAQYLGWQASSVATALVATSLSLGLSASTAAVAAILTRTRRLGIPGWAYRTGLGINVIAGVLVGGNLLVIEYAFDGLLEPVDIVFASGSFVTALGALVLCACAWLRRQRKVDEQEDQSQWRDS